MPDQHFTPDEDSHAPGPAREERTLRLPDPKATISQALDTSQAGQWDASTNQPAPRRLGEFELLAEIARGGMGVVYRARQASLNRDVAVKLIRGGEAATSLDVERFRREAEAAAALDHPGIVKVIQLGEADGCHYFAMELIDGQSLAEMCRQQPLNNRDAAEYALQIAGAVAFAHQQGVLHRDIKPSNVLIDGRGTVRVTDFGLAKFVASSDLTATGTALGTPSYMPPEQVLGDAAAIGERSDVYSIGATLYALLTGRPPFQADSAASTMLQVVNQPAAAPRVVNPSIDLDLETICLKCLEKQPAQRYASASDLAAELQRYLRGEPILARRPGRAELVVRWCRRNSKVAMLSALAIVLTAIALGVSVWGYVSTSRALQTAREREDEKDDALDEAEANFSRRGKRSSST